MQWRRGIAFAAVHLVVALAMVSHIEANEAAELRLMHSPNSQDADLPIKTPIPANEASGEILTFDMCNLTGIFSPDEEILIMANPGPSLITEWRTPCPPSWSISGMLVSTVWSRPSFAQFAKEQKVDVIFLLLIGIQWLLIGGFPLRPHRGLWSDPEAYITTCTVISGALSFVPNVESLCTAPMLCAFGAWFWWLCLVMVKILRSLLGFAKSWRLRRA